MNLLPEFKWRGDKHNIAQSPIAIFYKKKGKKIYTKKKGLKKYNLWLEYNSRKHIFLTIRFHDKHGATKIVLKQWDIFEMLLLRLRIKPLKKEKTRIMTRFGLGDMADISETYSRDTIKAKYDEALWNLRNIIEFAEGEKKELAEKQFDRLIKKEWILELLSDIDYANELDIGSTNIKKLKFEAIK